MRKRFKSPDAMLKYLVAAVLLAVPLYPKFPFIRVPQTFVSIRLEDILIAIIAIVFLPTFFSNFRSFFKSKVNKAIFVFLLTGFVSVVSGILLTKTVIAHIGLLHWLRRVEYFIPFFVGVQTIRKNRSNLEFYLKVLMLTVVIAFIYGFGQKHFSWPIIITQNQEYSKGVALQWIPGSHINSTFAGHYDLATFLVLVLPINVAIFATTFTMTKTIRLKVILAGLIFSGLWLLANSGSRISVLSYIVAIVGALFFIRKYRAIPIFIVLSILFLGLTSKQLVARYVRVIEVVQKEFRGGNRLFYSPSKLDVYASTPEFTFPQRRAGPTPLPTPTPRFEDRSTNIRLNVEWPRALRALSKNPLLGTGYSSITLATDNDYLRLLGEVGLLGFFAFLLIFARLGKLIIDKFPLSKNYKGLELAFVAGVVGSLPGLFLNAAFIDIFEASKFAIVFWLIIGFAVGLLSLNSYEQ